MKNSSVIIQGTNNEIFLRKADGSLVPRNNNVDNTGLPFINDKLNSTHIAFTLPFEQWYEAFNHVGPRALTHEDYCQDGNLVLDIQKNCHYEACILAKFTHYVL